MWLSLTELHDGEAGYTSHQLFRIENGSVSCSSLQDYYDAFSVLWRQRSEDQEALYEQYPDDPWSNVEFARAYCEIEKELYDELSGQLDYIRAGVTTTSITMSHPDAPSSGEPYDGTYSLDSGGDDVPDGEGRGFEAYASAYQSLYLEDFDQLYSDAYDCDIDSVDEEYFDSSAIDEAFESRSIEGSLEITDTSATSTHAEIDGQIYDDSYELIGEFTLDETFPRCEIAYESPFAVTDPEDEPVPGR